jgi:hypothetical protein
MNIAPFSYIPTTPAGYECSACGAKSCKLWRQYQMFADSIQLKCARCTGADISTLDDDGKIESPHYTKGGEVRVMKTNGLVDRIGHFGDDVPMPRTDQLNSLMPAVPTEDGDTFWGYTSVPPDGCFWWRSLPSLPKVPT